MPRSARLHPPAVLHHIMICGIDGTMIFRDNNDSNDMSERLAELLPKTNTSCYAWAFLPTRAHFPGSLPDRQKRSLFTEQAKLKV
ncbi:MAG: hypothetical protein JRJ03_04755 [Deltaproteobacteria bacterium]|nr:hypothetical protein [Deltaproteobacteria bacterium]